MLLFALIVGAIILSIVLNSFIKGFMLDALYADAIEDALENGKDENGMYQTSIDRSTMFYTTLGVIIVNNLIPFTLGAAIGLYAIS